MATPRVVPYGIGLRGTNNYYASDLDGNHDISMLDPDYRNALSIMDINGDVPMTALFSQSKSSRTQSPQFYWFNKATPTQEATITATNIYTDVTLATAASGPQAAGTELFIKMTTAQAKEFRVGHIVQLRDASAVSVYANARVTAKDVYDSTYTTLKIKLLAAMLTGIINVIDTVFVVGNSNPEASEIPDSISYDPVQIDNYTQIFRTPFELSRTELQTSVRTGSQFKERKRESLMLHGMEIEKAYLFGVKSLTTGANGKPERTTAGLIPMALSYGTTSNYYSDSSYDGVTWANGGKDWLWTYLEQIFRYGSNRRMAWCGSGALLGIQDLVDANTTMTITPGLNKYGLNVRTLECPMGTVELKTHPLFSQRTVDRNRMVLFEPENIEERFITKTTYKKDPNLMRAGFSAVDGIKSEFLTEAGLLFNHLETTAVLDGVGLDNPE